MLATALLATFSALFAYRALVEPWPGVDLHALNGTLWTACAVVAFVAGFISCLRWRTVGDASSLRVGSALVLLGVLITVVDLVPFVDAESRRNVFLIRLDASMTLTVAVLIAVAVIAPPIDTRVTAARRMLGISITVGALFGLVSVLTELEGFGHWSTDALNGRGDVAARAALVALWVVLGLISIARGLLRRSWLWTWLGLMLFAFASADILHVFASSRDDFWITGGLVLRLLALLFALNGVSQELKLAYLDQRSRLFDTRVSAEASEARRRAEQAEREERAHEARSALLAIQSATRRFEAHYEEVGAETQASLRDALESEIELLRRLVDTERAPVACEPFNITETIMPVVVCQRAAGRDVTAELPTGLRAVGRANELVEVVQTLLDNARDHAPRSSVVVRAQREGDRILVRVEDRGPGVAPSSRDRIFQRGVTSSRTGSGLGLYVARRLVREQGGDLWLEDRLGGGSSFVVSLPAPSPVLRCVPSAELVDEPNHARQSAHPDPLDAFGGEQ